MKSICAFLLAVTTLPQLCWAAEDAPLDVARSHGGERFAIDHMFFFTDGFAPELAYAQQHGFNRWPGATAHTGQGTSGAYIFFDNFYIEFLWIDEPDAATDNAINTKSDFNVRSKWRDDPQVSPFGFGLKDYREDELSPFATTRYSADWMGGSFDLFLTDNAHLVNEPWTFFSPLAVATEPKAQFGPQAAARLEHKNGARVLTGITLVLPEGQKPSKTLMTMQAEGIIDIAYGDAHLVELTFDNGAQSRMADLRPHSPIVVYY